MADHDHKAPQRLGVREFRGNVSCYLQQVRMGQSFLITSHNKVLAEIRPPAPDVQTPRKPGALQGKIRMADDFDLLPSDLPAAMEGDDG